MCCANLIRLGETESLLKSCANLAELGGRVDPSAIFESGIKHSPRQIDARRIPLLAFCTVDFVIASSLAIRPNRPYNTNKMSPWRRAWRIAASRPQWKWLPADQGRAAGALI